MNEVPAGAKPYPTSWASLQRNGHYCMENGSYSMYDGVYNLYIKGKVAITGGAYPNGVQVYLLEGSTLDATAATFLDLKLLFMLHRVLH